MKLPSLFMLLSLSVPAVYAVCEYDTWSLSCKGDNEECCKLSGTTCEPCEDNTCRWDPLSATCKANNGRCCSYSGTTCEPCEDSTCLWNIVTLTCEANNGRCCRHIGDECYPCDDETCRYDAKTLSCKAANGRCCEYKGTECYPCDDGTCLYNYFDIDEPFTCGAANGQCCFYNYFTLTCLSCSYPQPPFTLNTELASWMGRMVESIGDRKLFQVVLPGTHDSGTYGITPNSDVVAPEADDTLEDIINTADILEDLRVPQQARNVVSNFSVNQASRISQQLKMGVRYLDLRCYFDGSQWYITHSLKSISLDNAMEDIQSFLSEYPSEIVVMDFQKCFGVEDCFETLRKYVSAQFEGIGLITEEELKESTYAQLLNNDKSVFINYNDRSSIISEWPNTVDISELGTKLQAIQRKNEGASSLYVTQAVLTPSTDFIESKLIEFSLNPRQLSEEEWYSDWGIAGLAKQVYENLFSWMQVWEESGFLINIVMVDMVNEHFTSTVIDMNSRLPPLPSAAPTDSPTLNPSKDSTSSNKALSNQQGSAAPKHKMACIVVLMTWMSLICCLVV
mmetsp:Transcript_9206/g.16730  ORF Transcript_9206/g.16730 Transcript_9206/m.16730 type:complete len:565 (+) Transcript_9206:79-1773(+)